MHCRATIRYIPPCDNTPVGQAANARQPKISCPAFSARTESSGCLHFHPLLSRRSTVCRTYRVLCFTTRPAASAPKSTFHRILKSRQIDPFLHSAGKRLGSISPLVQIGQYEFTDGRRGLGWRQEFQGSWNRNCPPLPHVPPLGN